MEKQLSEDVITLVFLLNGSKCWVEVSKKLLMNVSHFNRLFNSEFRESSKKIIHIDFEVTKQMVKEYLDWLKMLEKFGSTEKVVQQIYTKIYIPTESTETDITELMAVRHLDSSSDILCRDFTEFYSDSNGRFFVPNKSLISFLQKETEFYSCHITLADYVRKIDIVTNANKKVWSLQTFRLAFFLCDEVFLTHVEKPRTTEIKSAEEIPPELVDWYCSKYIEELYNPECPDFARRVHMFCNSNPVLGELIWTNVSDKSDLLEALQTPVKKKAAMKKITSFEELCTQVQKMSMQNDPLQNEINELKRIRFSSLQGKQGKSLNIYLSQYAGLNPEMFDDITSDKRPLLINALTKKIVDLKKAIDQKNNKQIDTN
jgi:hypothetical protein